MAQLGLARRWRLLVFALAASLTSGVISLAAAPAAASEAPPVAEDLRVGTFNLYGANNDNNVSGNKRWARREPVAAAQIMGERLDVVGLQEASPTSDQAGDLATALNLIGGTYAVVGTASFSNGTKIIYNRNRVELVTSGVYKYRSQAKKSINNPYRQRFLTWATFRMVNSGKRFFFADTHLDPYSSKNSAKSVKVTQWRELVSVVPKINTGRLPVVVVGDFNTSKWWIEAKKMLPAMRAAGFGDLMNQQYRVNPPKRARAETVVNGWVNSYNAFRNNVKKYSYYTKHSKVGNGIDWIFATNSLRVKRWKVVINFNPKTLKTIGVIPSDHCMITATVVL